MSAPVFRLPTRRGPLELGPESQVAGILNLTPDSFSDGGRHLDPEAAVAHALAMEAAGAALIDVGACSTRPGAEAVPPAEELRRLEAVVPVLAARLRVPISIDTWRAEVFRRCHELGADLLNDVSAARLDPEMPAVLAATGAPAILMHMQGEPRTMQVAPRYDDVVAEIGAAFAQALDRLAGFGVSCDRIVLDPGIGFGKTLEHNLAILRRIEEFHALGRPLMVGTSRKSFLGQLLDRPHPADRDHGTLATTVWLRSRGVQLLRVHDVRAAVDALTVARHLDNEGRS
ncbi:MAG: dihydropteroate synthase [Planctomycetes bacterium]|nr:dihydropteroate synthase [Planctomycetota bacterium]